MALPVIPDVSRCAIEWQTSGAGASAVSVLHIWSSTITDPYAVGTLLETLIPNNCFLFTSDDAHATQVTVTPLDGISASGVVPLTTWDGQATGEVVPQLSAMLQMHTIERGPARRGRMFMPYLTETVMDEGRCDETLRATCAAAWEDFQDALVAVDAGFTVASYKNEDHSGVVNFAVGSAPGRIKRRLG